MVRIFKRITAIKGIDNEKCLVFSNKMAAFKRILSMKCSVESSWIRMVYYSQEMLKIMSVLRLKRSRKI